MKTSNKLLIAFAAALILIPILGMVYVSRVYYKVGTAKDTDVVYKVDDFNTATPGMASIPVVNAFQSVEIGDAQNFRLDIVLVKDQKFGIKVPNDLKDLIKVAVAENGKLVLTMAPGSNANQGHALIYVYAPTIAALNIDKANRLSLNVSSDTLALTVKNIGHVYLSDNSKLNKLTVNANDVEKVDMNGNTVETLGLTLTNTDFSTERTSYTNLAISTAGKCELEINGGYEKTDEFSIKNMVINTTGKANVEVKNIKVLNCAGSFSDETIVNMPAANLNQMFKK